MILMVGIIVMLVFGICCVDGGGCIRGYYGVLILAGHECQGH